MGMMQPKVHGVEEVKATIRMIEDNTQCSEAPADTGKQSIVQDVKNTMASGSNGFGSGSHKRW